MSGNSRNFALSMACLQFCFQAANGYNVSVCRLHGIVFREGRLPVLSNTLCMSELKIFKSGKSLTLESGVQLNDIEIGYHTYGKLNNSCEGVIWICHAFTANSDAADWWKGMVGEGCVFDPAKYFIVCANIIGSCYGTTGPLSVNPSTGKPFFLAFPDITVRDLVAAHELLRKHLAIERIHTVVGGSIGAQQAIEWAILKPNLFKHLIIIAAGAYYTPWAIALNESQRMALLADSTFTDETPDAGNKGLMAARSIALLSYRNYMAYNKTQAEENNEKTGDFKAGSYQRYQGQKLARRFHAHSYFSILKTLDSHNVGRGRASIEHALSVIRAKTLVIGISSDLLFPLQEQEFLAEHIRGAVLKTIDSIFGHDGFLVEVEKQSRIINDFYSETEPEHK